jgi:hypothetical protein
MSNEMVFVNYNVREISCGLKLKSSGVLGRVGW